MISSAIVTLAIHASFSVPTSLAVTHRLDPYLGVYVAETPKYIVRFIHRAISSPTIPDIWN